MTIINDFDGFVDAHKKEGGVVLEVTQKIYYAIPSYNSLPLEELKKEWFEDFKNRSHAYKDASQIGQKVDIVKIKEL